MNAKVVTLDIRDDVRQGREPCSRVMEAISQLQKGEELMLGAPYEPVTLFAVMARKGFPHKATPTGTGDWEVLFSRSATPIAVNMGGIIVHLIRPKVLPLLLNPAMKVSP